MVSSYPSFDIKRFKKKNFEVSPPSCIQTHCVDKTILVHQSWLDLTSGTFNHISHFVSFEETPFVSWFIYFSPLTPHPAPPPHPYPWIFIRIFCCANPKKNTQTRQKTPKVSPNHHHFPHVTFLFGTCQALKESKPVVLRDHQSSKMVESRVGRHGKKNCCEFCFPSFF